MASQITEKVCPICGRTRSNEQMVHKDIVGPAIDAFATHRSEDWKNAKEVCTDCLKEYRNEYLRHLLGKEKKELSVMEEQVRESLEQNEMLSRNMNEEFDKNLSYGDRLSDKIAAFGGSWAFILSFGGVLLGWIVINSIALFSKPFDPYPFILLNLILSTLAALQAPIIMMSQNRQEAKDRLRAEHDYAVNLKAEVEVRTLHTKLDQLITRQWHRLLEIQQLQVNMIEDLTRHQTALGEEWKKKQTKTDTIL